MKTQSTVVPPGDPLPPVPLDGLRDRFVALLGLPGDDPEVQDITVMVHAALEAARQTGQAELLDDVLRFTQGRLVVRGLTGADYSGIAAALESAAGVALDADGRRNLHALLARGAGGPIMSTEPHAEVLGPLSAAYLEHLVQGDRKGAVDLIRQCVTDGMDIYEILLDILEPAQHEVGRRWAHGLISVAQEHFCTAVTQFVMTDLYPGLFTGEDSHRRLMAVHVPGSTHHVGLRMVVDVLECRDWSTTYVVDDIAVDALPGLVAEDQADLLLISASMPSHIPPVMAMIRALHEDPRTRGVKVVVGGRPFRIAPGLVEAVGADAWARDARHAVDVCHELIGADRGQR